MRFALESRRMVGTACVLAILIAPLDGLAQDPAPSVGEAEPAATGESFDPARLDVADAGLAYHLAHEAIWRGELERAAALLEIAVALDPAAVLPRLDRVEVLLELNRAPAAGGLLDPIADRVASQTERMPSTAARYHRLRGALALRTGDPTAAIEGYERAAKLAPWDLGLRAQLIGLHRASGDPASAIPHLEAATRVLPFNAELKTELGDALLDLERYAEARDVYLEALELVPAASRLHQTIERKIDRARAAIDR
ncbi:MAG: tetratricopeptide repeat protein [Gemmatimonadota bacterium]|nr:tetratricopeptide repeat protein [Gemmatimonadota bacterium]